MLDIEKIKASALSGNTVYQSQAVHELITRMEAAEKDAARYRWLLTKDNEREIYIGARFEDCYAAWSGKDGIIGFEAVIDKAMKESEK